MFNSLKQKKLIFNFFVNRNWKKLTDSRKRAKILADNRKSHHPIETLLNVHARVQHFLDSCRKLPIMFRFGSRHGPSTTRTKVGWKVWLITDLIKLSKKALTQLGEVPVCWAGGREFKPRPDQHSWFLLDNWEERAAFVITSANG